MGRLWSYQSPQVTLGTSATNGVLVLEALPLGTAIREAEITFNSADATHAKVECKLAVLSAATGTAMTGGNAANTLTGSTDATITTTAVYDCGTSVTVSELLYASYASPYTGWRWASPYVTGSAEKVGLIVENQGVAHIVRARFIIEEF